MHRREGKVCECAQSCVVVHVYVKCEQGGKEPWKPDSPLEATQACGPS